MKKCSKCEAEKDMSEFYKSKRYKDGSYPSCKKCESERSLNYYNINKDQQLIKKRERYYKNHDTELSKKREYDRINRAEVNERARNRYYDNIDYAREYYKTNKEEILKRNKKWIEDNKEHFDKINTENTKKWLKKNPQVVAWRQMLYRTIKRFGKLKESSTNDLLGYSAEDLKNHMERLFEPGMSWDNWGEWHIDHIIPLCTFDKETPINEVNSLLNLRPLWALENLKRKKKG